MRYQTARERVWKSVRNLDAPDSFCHLVVGWENLDRIDVLGRTVRFVKIPALRRAAQIDLKVWT